MAAGSRWARASRVVRWLSGSTRYHHQPAPCGTAARADADPALEYQRAMTEALLEAWDVGDSPELRAAVGLALGFHTWRTLARTFGLRRDRTVEVMASIVACLAVRLAGTD